MSARFSQRQETGKNHHAIRVERDTSSKFTKRNKNTHTRQSLSFRQVLSMSAMVLENAALFVDPRGMSVANPRRMSSRVGTL